MDENNDNIVSLPDTLHFWSCALCGINIQASMQEQDLDFPTVITARCQAANFEKRMVFCSECTKNRPGDIDKFVAQKVSYEGSDLRPKLNFGDNEPWLDFESEGSNLLGEKLNLLVWRSRTLGAVAALTFSTKSENRLICYNFSGMSHHDLGVALKYIKTHYKTEFGDLVEKKKGRRFSLSGMYLPLFRCRLLGIDKDFCVYRNDDDIGLRIDFCEIQINNAELMELKDITSAAASFLQMGTLGSLQSFKKKKKGSEIWSVKSPSLIVRAKLSRDKICEVYNVGTSVCLRIGSAKIAVDLIDFLEMSKILEGMPSIIQEKNAIRRNKSVDLLRKARYIRINKHIPVSHKLVMMDLGWKFDLPI